MFGPYGWMAVALGSALLADRYPSRRVPFLVGSAAALGVGLLTLSEKPIGPARAASPTVPRSPVPIGERGLIRLGPTGSAPELGTPTDPAYEDLIVVVDGVEGDRLRVRAVGYRRRENGVLRRSIFPASDAFMVRAAAVRPEDRIL